MAGTENLLAFVSARLVGGLAEGLPLDVPVVTWLGECPSTIKIIEQGCFIADYVGELLVQRLPMKDSLIPTHTFLLHTLDAGNMHHQSIAWSSLADALMCLIGQAKMWSVAAMFLWNS